MLVAVAPLPGIGVRAEKAIKKGDRAGLQLLSWEKPIAPFWAKIHLSKGYKAKRQIQRVQTSSRSQKLLQLAGAMGAGRQSPRSTGKQLRSDSQSLAPLAEDPRERWRWTRSW